MWCLVLADPLVVEDREVFAANLLVLMLLGLSWVLGGGRWLLWSLWLLPYIAV